MRNTLIHRIGALGALLAMSLPIAASAETRPAVASFSAVPALSTAAIGHTVSRGRVKTSASSDLFGAPLFLVFLGAVAITIGTIVIVNNNNGGGSPASPG